METAIAVFWFALVTLMWVVPELRRIAAALEKLAADHDHADMRVLDALRRAFE